ncbi:NYN domain-containing protein [Synergistaceae bacterium OttesenSCG-928-I11]|nr:NYN domain-containing protein [Synergistaceae bacterium OttesenSCG-928-I11]
MEALESTIYKKFDVLVLISGDEDFLPLIRKLNALGVRVMLLGWNYEYTDANGNERQTKTSGRLMSEATHVLKMNELIDNPPRSWSGMIDRLFVARPRPQVEEIEPEEKWERGKTSRLCNGSGFISEDGKPSTTAVFFHYSSLEDVDFYDLAVGVRVEYKQAQDSVENEKSPPAESVRLDKK